MGEVREGLVRVMFVSFEGSKEVAGGICQLKYSIPFFPQPTNFTTGTPPLIGRALSRVPFWKLPKGTPPKPEIGESGFTTEAWCQRRKRCWMGGPSAPSSAVGPRPTYLGGSVLFEATFLFGRCQRETQRETTILGVP